MAVAADSGAPPAPTREPGDFARHPSTGAPYVNHPTDVTKDGRPRRVMYGRPSSFGAMLDNPFNLVKWKERQLLIGVGELLVKPKFSVPVDRDELDGLAAQAHEAAGSSLAADQGTHVHRLLEYQDTGRDIAELLDAGETLGIPAALQRRVVEQWCTFRAAHGIRALAVEQTIVNDGWRLAGTLDRLDVVDRPVLTAFGVLDHAFVGDIKTGGLTLGHDGQPNYWVKYPVQLAAYADGVPYNTDTDQRGAWQQEPDPHIALIYHYDLARAIGGEVVDWQAIPVSVDAGREGGELCRAAADFGKRRDLFAMPAPVAATGDTAGAQPAAGPEPPPAVPSATAQGPAANPLEGVICMRGRCPNCKRTVNLVNHQCGPAAEPVVPDVIAAQAAKQAAKTEAPLDRRAALLARYQQLSDDDKRRYMAIKPVNTDDLDAVEAALDQIDPFAQHHEPATPPTVPSLPPIEQPDEGGPVDPADKTALDAAFQALPPAAREVAATIAKEANDAGRSMSVTQRPTVRRWKIARAVISWVSAGRSVDDMWCAAVIIADEHAVVDENLTLGALLGGFTIGQADALYDALEHAAAAA